MYNTFKNLDYDKHFSFIYNNGNAFELEYVSRLFDGSEFIGVYGIIYDIDVLDKLINPLYKATEDMEEQSFNLFIYANEIDFRTGEIIWPTYDAPVFQKTDGLDIPEADFDNNMTNLFVETVFTSQINGITYQIYSQSVPDGAESRDDVIYYLFFLIERDQSYASE